MSFLLDALRKSENQKHLGDVPTIHSSPGPELNSRSPFKPGLIALVLLPAVLVVAWYSWQSWGQTETATEIPARPAELGKAKVVDAAPAALESVLPEGPPDVIQSSASSAERTAVERFSAPASNPSIVQEQDPGVATGPSAVQMETARAESLSPPEREGLQDSGSQTDVSTPVSVPQERDYREPQLSTISYWRVPESVRQEFVQPKISVLVYAQQPEERFLIMNGQRVTEGDEPQPGLVLREIRRDGAVFSYRLYRFLVSR